MDMEVIRLLSKRAKESLYQMEITCVGNTTFLSRASVVRDALNLLDGLIPIAESADDKSIEMALIDWAPSTQKITKALGMPEVLAQLAEEAAELSQAALKLRRALDKRNPTPIAAAVADKDLQEEFSDVLLCMTMVGVEKGVVERTIRAKARRWATRLENGGADSD